MKTPSEILKKYWGYDQFRALQLEIIESVLEGKDTLALLPTGGGKSICFQVPAMAIEGVCIVVSPLIALMKDQVAQLNNRGIKAIALHAGMSRREIDIALDNIAYGAYRFVYVSPERLKSELFRVRAEKMNISLLAIDEAHCISQWGYDFRPSYLEIAEFREEFQIDKLIALTATATKQVKQDICDKLVMKDPMIFQKSFARFNLSYSVFQLENKMTKCLQVLQNVPGSSVVYVRTRKRTRMVAEELYRHGISVSYYHAGLSPLERASRQEKWISGQIRVIVSTNAFGMGIDKPDVRSVIHMDVPDSLESYYQEAGRAGRDEQKAYAVLLFSPNEINELKIRVEEAHVGLELIKRVYQSLANYYKLAIGSGMNLSFEFDYEKLVSTFDLPPVQTFHALRKLEDEGLIQISEGFYQSSRLICLIEHDELYKFQVANQPFDGLIKVILRLYGGEIYKDYVTIKENEIARLLNVQKDVVIKQLNMLSDYEIIDYHAASAAPHLTFTTPRKDVNTLPIDQEMIKWRKEVALKKVEEVARYLENSKKCRSRMLQEYFDEQTEANCGVCDYCINIKKSEMVRDPAEILDAIPAEGIGIDDLSKKMGMNKALLLDELRKLLDESRLQYDVVAQTIRKNGNSEIE